MCGINGILCLDDGATDAQRLAANLRAMNAALAHRGPDGEGEYFDRGLALGHRRLAILDLSENGRQPMFNEDQSLVLVFNGEIYNYLELIPELKHRGHVFRSHTDSEVILHAYEEWGADCVHRFNGMWAFAIWDTRRRRLFCSRDRLGVKPFYYREGEGRVLFSSEQAGILAVQPIREANLGKLHDFLAYGYRTNNGETFFAGINELRPGHNLMIENGRGHATQYWSLPEEALSQESDATLIERFDHLLTDAVRLRFRSDVPVALLQSGGLDSSAICRVVDEEVEAGRLGCSSVTAFTAVFPGHKYDESAQVEALMAASRHVQSVRITPDEGDLTSSLPEFVRRMNYPVFSATAFVHWRLMRAVHERGIKVIINGQGSDEAFAGYGRYITGYRLLDLLLSEPLRAVGEARAMKQLLGYGWPMLLAQTGKAVLGRRAASKWRGYLSEGALRVLAPDFHRANDAYLQDQSMTFAPRNLDKHLRGQIQHYGFNQILHYEDHSSMMESVEMRSPFVDYRLMEFAFTLPDRLKFHAGVTKRILREAFARRLPECIVNNHHKIGFGTPFDVWRKTPAMREMVRQLVNSAEFNSRSIWKQGVLRRYLQDEAAAPADFPAWRFMVVELWAREYGITNL